MSSEKQPIGNEGSTSSLEPLEGAGGVAPVHSYILDEKVELAKDNFSLNNGDEEVHQLATEIAGGALGETLGLSEHDIDYMHNIIRSMTIEEAREILEDALVEHRFDRNFPLKSYELIQKLLEGHKIGNDIEGIDNEFTMKAEASLIRYHSPYPEVRAVTDPYDDDTLTVESIRSYLLGSIWVIIGVGVNQFFEPHQPPVSLPASLFQLLVLPCGLILAKILPDWGFTIRGTRISLNPGPWTYKEQLFCTIMFGISAALPYVDSQIFVQKLPRFYDNKWAGPGFQFLLTLSTQFMGFGIAGLLRTILIYPTYNIWMTNFPTLALNRSLMKPEGQEPIHGWKITRYAFFGIAFVSIFFYEWLPNYLMQFLSTFNWMTWIAPDNINLAAITGSATGLGINPISTFDWNVIDYSVPLVRPYFAQANVFVGAVIAGCAFIPAVYYSNTYHTAYLPINSASLFTNTGDPYDIHQILTDNVFDAEKYQKYSPPYYTASNLVNYGTFFAAYTNVFVRSLLYDWRIMYQGYIEIFYALTGKGKGLKSFKDAHCRMMQKYPETPMWWFMAVLLVSLALAIGCVEGYKDTKTPVWGIFFALAIGIIFLVPIGNLYAQTSNLFSLNVLAELVAGYALPGHGTAMMIIKAFGLNINLQAMYFMQDMKLGHYAKIPPRATFRAQILASVWSSLVMIGIANWQMSNISDLCNPKLKDNTKKFTCPNETVYFSASVIWGVIGPRRIFDSQYPVLKWCFLIGAIIPIPFWAFDVYGPLLISKLNGSKTGSDNEGEPRPSFGVRLLRSLWKLNRSFDTSLFMMGTLNYFAPYNLSYIVTSFYVSFIFMKWIRERYVAWFEKYVYVLSAALTAGTAFSLLIIFFALQYRANSSGVELSWWGNNVMYNGADGVGVPISTLAPGEFFGPAPGNYYV